MPTRVHGRPINTKTARAILLPRSEPFWNSLGQGRAIGFRRSKVGAGGTWVARWTAPSKGPDETRNKSMQAELGPVEESHPEGLAYASALGKAQEFFAEAEQQWRMTRRGTPAGQIKTVADACRVYVDKLKNAKATPELGEASAARAHAQFQRHVYNHELGSLKLRELTPMDVEQWRDSLVTPSRAKNTVNRTMKTFKAAMNYCFKRQLIPSDAAWRAVEAFPVVDGSQRRMYVTMEQRRALLTACDEDKSEKDLYSDYDLEWATPDLGNFIRAMLYTGARPSELANARVRDLDLRTRTLALVNHKGKDSAPHTRAFPLDDPQALTFFTRMAKDKTPAAYLLTKADGSSWANEKGTQRHQWGRGFRAAVRRANRNLRAEGKTPMTGNTTAYSLRHTKITDWLEAGEPLQRVAVVTGTSIVMIEKHYFKFLRHGDNSRLAAVQSF